MLLLSAFFFLGQGSAHAIRLEAEDARLFGPVVANNRPGFSGTGYVTGFTHDGDHIVWHTKAPAGIYDVRIGYSAPLGEKGYDLVVDGSKFSGMFAKTADVFGVAPAGKVELKSGDNEIEIDKGWGYFDVDYIEFTPALPPEKLLIPARTLTDPSATAAANKLFSYLVSQYGRGALSGQYDPEDSKYVVAQTGVAPAIIGGDFIDYSPSRVEHGSKPEGTTESYVGYAHAGQIVTMSWHWNAPKDLVDKISTDAKGEKVDNSWYKGFYTTATTFDLAKAISDENSEDYKLLLRDIDTIAVQLKKFSAAGIPILWRPLHEAEGGWFWWGAKGPEPFKKLWKLMYRRLTVDHGLHNLIWVYSSGTNPDWYPGDEFVDIVGIDAYPTDPSDPLVTTWQTLQERFAGKKLLAISEFGGVPDIERMRRFGVRWSYFVSWSGGLGAKMIKPVSRLRELYREKPVIDQGSLPRF